MIARVTREVWEGSYGRWDMSDRAAQRERVGWPPRESDAERRSRSLLLAAWGRPGGGEIAPEALSEGAGEPLRTPMLSAWLMEKVAQITGESLSRRIRGFRSGQRPSAPTRSSFIGNGGKSEQ